MTKRFHFSIKWAIIGAAFGVLLAMVICWQEAAWWPYWAALGLVSALAWGFVGGFLGEGTIDLIIDCFIHSR